MASVFDLEQMAAGTPFRSWEILPDGIGFGLRMVKGGARPPEPGGRRGRPA
ncbi:MAG TPA: hypothetical protein VND93_11885 [Myxococcales bacterium]|nr:hypothetical protein [Myxococcales bacterium]